jgi:hypothetical protein
MTGRCLLNDRFGRAGFRDRLTAIGRDFPACSPSSVSAPPFRRRLDRPVTRIAKLRAICAEAAGAPPRSTEAGKSVEFLAARERVSLRQTAAFAETLRQAARDTPDRAGVERVQQRCM